VNITDATAQAIREVVRGERSWRTLNDYGITIDVTAEGVATFGAIKAPVQVSIDDVARGWLRYSGDSRALREWARVVHGGVGLIDLTFADDRTGETLLDLLWRVNFGEPATEEMHQEVRRILVHESL